MSYAHPEYLISPAELAADLDGRRVLDAAVFLSPAPKGGFRAESGLERFNEGHIPGALFLDLVGDASDTSTGLGFTLPPVAQLERLFARLGVSNDTEVVLYSSGHIMWATRAWWLLHYCGHRRARVLNGGLLAWRDGGHPLSTEAASHPEGNFKATPDAALFADQDAVLAAIGDGDVCTVNALSPEMYAGEGDFSYGRKGHIAGSINLHYEDLLEDGCFKDGEALREALNAKGLLAAPQVISYCGGGISATIDAFACLLCGKEEVAVYDGSMAEWVRDESLPMETGP
ncbi:MAG: sulfurtransferase [Gammaproteobacteria bacterium]|nr:sulfurtransferase [Gammaproteobacteria bacterium]MYF49601.1 sulfurtransferase [Gammaproteobacteria bacterium]